MVCVSDGHFHYSSRDLQINEHKKSQSLRLAFFAIYFTSNTYFEAISTNSSYVTNLSVNFTVLLKYSVNLDSANIS